MKSLRYLALLRTTFVSATLISLLLAWFQRGILAENDKLYIAFEDKIYFTLKEITIGDNTLEELDLKLVSKADLMKEIKETF